MLSGFGIGWHYEIGMQIVRMIVGGAFVQFAGLKKNIGDYFKENVYVNPSGMMYAPQLHFCLDSFDEDHILWGEDYPKRIPENIRTMLENADIPESAREKIAHGNAEKLFGI